MGRMTKPLLIILLLLPLVASANRPHLRMQIESDIYGGDQGRVQWVDGL